MVGCIRHRVRATDSGGFVLWSKGLCTATFEDVFGAPCAQINLIETCLTVTTNLLSSVADILIDRWSIRHLMLIGMVADDLSDQSYSAWVMTPMFTESM